MAFSSLLRKSASSLRPLADHLLKTPRNFHPLLCTAINHATHSRTPSLNPFVPTSHFSSAQPKKFPSDESLLRALESEIRCAEEADDHNRVEHIPSDFPFEITDTPGQQTITLQRKYQDENIKVEVHMPDLVTGENEDDRDDDNESERASQSSIPLVVSVSKNGGPSLEFTCMAYPEEIAIDSLIVKNPENTEDQIAYEGPDFQDLDENLQKAFQKYLEIRGIKPRTTNFLHEYMINKDSKEYVVWMKKLMRFIED
ncbi:Mitochondrial glycoprotein [Senna tora]|uniref:Mitochondrial glycoprotein n=1 Tax=Senna tora TaxID=362788 RepID=A0A834TYS0_9FABA|nr:Mitochondrial glycoprotein [Senna tora]